MQDAINKIEFGLFHASMASLKTTQNRVHFPFDQITPHYHAFNAIKTTLMDRRCWCSQTLRMCLWPGYLLRARVQCVKFWHVTHQWFPIIRTFHLMCSQTGGWMMKGLMIDAVKIVNTSDEHLINI